MDKKIIENEGLLVSFNNYPPMFLHQGFLFYTILKIINYYELKIANKRHFKIKKI